MEIVGYDPSWPAAFQAERGRLAPLLPGAQIHHVGSTAVRGLAARLSPSGWQRVQGRDR
ncbi:MAG: GrpB family protein [Solirubrobacteraceae bacterium]